LKNTHQRGATEKDEVLVLSGEEREEGGGGEREAPPLRLL
jgi:hypothetical protein